MPFDMFRTPNITESERIHLSLFFTFLEYLRISIIKPVGGIKKTPEN